MLNILKLLSEKKIWPNKIQAVLILYYSKLNNNIIQNPQDKNKSVCYITHIEVLYTTSVHRKNKNKIVAVINSSMPNSITSLWDTIRFCSLLKKEKGKYRLKSIQFLIYQDNRNQMV